MKWSRWIGVVAVAACGTPHAHGPSDAAVEGDGGAGDAAGGGGSDAAHGSDPDASVQPHDAATADAFPAVLDMKLDCHNDCTLHAMPSSIAVHAGTSFEVDWKNVGDTPCDVAKIDQFNQVPIVLDLEPGDSYLDSVRMWCGTQFTGTFQFRIDICTIPSYIPVDCGAP